ncbi:MAG: FAD-dependent oxidoreductase [Deinococcales bacterium]
MSRVAAPIVIVGAGVAGLSLAYALGRRGRRALVLERGRVGAQGASSGPAALVNPPRGRSARAHPDDLAGLAAFWRVVGELEAAGLDPGAHRSGVLRIAPSASRARAWQKLASGRWLEAREVPPPYLAPHGALLSEAGGWLRPRALLSALKAASLDAGVEVREGVRVLALEASAGAVRLTTSAGRLSAPWAVLCVGADPSPGLPLPQLTSIAGDVVGVPTRALSAAPGPALGGSVYVAFDAGTAYVGGNHRDPEVPDPAAPRRLLERLDAALPGIADARATSLWSGVRARRPDGPRPLVTDVAASVTLFGALSGRGFLCAAALADALTERLAGT